MTFFEEWDVCLAPAFGFGGYSGLNYVKVRSQLPWWRFVLSECCCLILVLFAFTSACLLHRCRLSIRICLVIAFDHWHFVIQYEGADIVITLSRFMCVDVYFSTIKRKPLVALTDLKLGKIVVFDTMPKPINFGLKRVRGTGSLAIFGTVAESTMKSLYNTPCPQCGVTQSNFDFRVGVDLLLHRVHILVNFYCH